MKSLIRKIKISSLTNVIFTDEEQKYINYINLIEKSDIYMINMNITEVSSNITTKHQQYEYFYNNIQLLRYNTSSPYLLFNREHILKVFGLNNYTIRNNLYILIKDNIKTPFDINNIINLRSHTFNNKIPDIEYQIKNGI